MSKSFALCATRSNPHQHPFATLLTDLPYRIRTTLKTSESLSTVNSALTPIPSKSRTRLQPGFILRTSSYLGLHQPSSTLFNFLLLTIVEYCTVIWTPSHNCDCLVLKKVQRKCTYCLFFKKNFLLPDTPRLTSSS